MTRTTIDRAKKFAKATATVLLVVALPIWIFPFAIYIVVTDAYRSLYDVLWDD